MSLSQLKVSKRVPNQYHLKLFTGEVYKGLPVYVHPDGLVLNYLDCLYNVIHSSSSKYSKVFAVRVDLRFPRSYYSLDQESLSNEYLHIFIRCLRHKLQRYQAERQQLGYRVHDAGFKYVWAREYGPNSGRPHFHLLLLFNGHAFNRVGQFSSARENLYTRIRESWAESLGLHLSEGARFAHFSDGGQYLIHSKCSENLTALFYRGSYLTKVVTKNFHDGFHVFGGSRR
jgi:hypothetical protein